MLRNVRKCLEREQTIGKWIVDKRFFIVIREDLSQVVPPQVSLLHMELIILAVFYFNSHSP
jgi:hypothetical protein